MTSEIILIDKPLGLSSAGVVRLLKPAFPGLKIGHAGSLDPLASGLLIVLVGQATKKFGQFQKEIKTYQAEIIFGLSTDTLDQEGEIKAKNQLKDVYKRISKIKLQQVISKFPLKYSQTVPAYSAAKYKGKPLYWWKRNFPNRKLPPKEKVVEIKKIKLVFYKSGYPNSYPIAKLEIEVKSGFYVRQFAFDLGKKLNLNSSLFSLRRLAIGEYKL